MAKSDRFRQQHNELLELANTLAKELDAGKLAQDGFAARSALNKLAGKLTLHLAAEDDYLYPDLLNSSDSKIQKTAKLFVDEMGGIAKAFLSYNDKWRTASAIQGDPGGFITETKAIYQALAQRIDKENNELYPLLDKSAA